MKVDTSSEPMVPRKSAEPAAPRPALLRTEDERRPSEAPPPRREERRDAILVLGIGNPGRQDDGLGPALAAAVEHLAIPGVTVDADYQLTVEDAAAIAEHDVVIFADADAAGDAPFSFSSVAPRRTLEWSSHGVEPETLLGLVEEIFGHAPPAYVLGIRGRRFGELREELGDEARQNLAQALAFVESWLRARSGVTALRLEEHCQGSSR